MQKRLFILLWKEARHQAVLLWGGAVVFGLVALLFWIGKSANPRSTSNLEAINAALMLFLPLFGLVLGHRTVVREYQAKTQLFLEALPLRRFEAVLAKFAFGLLVQAALSGAIVSLGAAGSGDATPKFIAILNLRAFGFLFALWALLFAMGLLGRLRIPAYLALGCGLAVLDMVTGFELQRFGPIALIDPGSFPYERNEMPWRALAESMAFGACFLGLGFVLALFHEGSVAEVLARRASARELAGFWALGFAELVAIAWASERQVPAPFAFTSSSVLRSRTANAEVMHAWPALEARGKETLSALEELAARLKSELGVPNHPALRISHNGLIDSTRARPATAEGSGVLLEVNLGFRGFEREIVLADVCHQLFLELSKGRAAFEPNHWFLDGFSARWLSANDERSAELHWVRAGVALRRLEANVATIASWERTMELVGETAATSLGYTLVEVLEQRHSRAVGLELAREILVRPSVENVVDWFRPIRRDVVRLFERRTGGGQVSSKRGRGIFAPALARGVSPSSS